MITIRVLFTESLNKERKEAHLLTKCKKYFLSSFDWFRIKCVNPLKRRALLVFFVCKNDMILHETPKNLLPNGHSMSYISRGDKPLERFQHSHKARGGTLWTHQHTFFGTSFLLGLTVRKTHRTVTIIFWNLSIIQSYQMMFYILKKGESRCHGTIEPW